MKRILYLAVVLFAGCSQSMSPSMSEATPDDAGGESAGDAGFVPEDAGGVSARRTLSSAPPTLFGEGPIENRFINPDFDLAAEGWQAFPVRPGATELPRLRKLIRYDAPTRQPILVLPKGDNNPFGVGVMGTARSTVGMVAVGIWVGRPVASAEQPVSVALAGLQEDGGEQVYPLAPRVGSRRDVAGVAWVRYEVGLAEGPAGYVQLIVQDDTDVPIYLTGPVLTAMAGRVRGQAAQRRAPVARPATPVERRGLAVWAAAQQRKLRRPTLRRPRP